MALIHVAYVRQKIYMHAAIFTQISAFINLDASVRAAQICQV